MKKILKMQLLAWIAFIISVIIFVIESLQGMSIFGESDPLSLLGNVCGIVAVISILAFLVLYIIRIVKEQNIKIKLLLILTPILGAIFSTIFVNGYFENTELLETISNIIFVILASIMIILYNMFILYYCDSKVKPYFSVVLYNLVTIFVCLNGEGLGFVHHYYLGYLILFLPIMIIEHLIKDKFFNKVK